MLQYLSSRGLFIKGRTKNTGIEKKVLKSMVTNSWEEGGVFFFHLCVKCVMYILC